MPPWFTVFTDYANLSMWHWKFGGEGHSEGPNHWESTTAETTTREERGRDKEVNNRETQI
jgi:hypothetical protein